MNKIDLHMHSDVSLDGFYRPQELVDMCVKNGLTHIAIADHDSVGGVLELLSQKTPLPIDLIPAIEIDCVYGEKEFHLLGYGIDPYADAYKEIEESFISQEINHTNERVRFAKEDLGLCFDEEYLNSLKHRDILTAEAIMDACLQDERNFDKEIMKPYLPNGSRSVNPMVNFYWDYFAQGKPGYHSVHFPNLVDMVKMIHEQSGIAILAHPGNNIKEDMELLDHIVECGIDGLEVYSSYHNQDQIKIYRDYANAHNLLKTCGSDFHGKTKPSISLGQCDCSEEEQAILYEVLDKLKVKSN